MTESDIVRRHRPIAVSFRDVGNTRTRVLELAGTGTPLICLHGFSDQADTWRPMMRALQHAERHVVAVDLPGFGRATALEPGPILDQLDRFVATLTTELADRAGRPAVLIGNSLGGCAALRAAANPRLPIAGIVAISPAGFGHSRAIKFAERRGGLTPLLERGGLPMPVVRSIMSTAFRGAASPKPRAVDREAVRAWTAQFQHRGDLLRVLGSANQVLVELNATPRNVRLQVPILLLWGDRDRLTLHTGARHILDANPHAEFVRLRGHGHCPHLEIAPRIATLIADFADRVSRQPSRVTPAGSQ